MDKTEIKKYIKDSGKVCGGKSNFIKFLFSLIDICEAPEFMNYMETSRFESSLPIDFAGRTGRFIHYLRFKKNLPLKLRKLAGYNSTMRIINIMKKAQFKIIRAFEIVLFCGEVFNVFPNTIISCEWDFKKREFKKFTLYIVCGKDFNRGKCQKFSEIVGIKDPHLIYKLSRNIDFLGLDFFYNGDIVVKIYNRFPVSYKFKPMKWEDKIFKTLGDELISVIRVTRINVGKEEISENEKSHFITKGILFSLFLKDFDFKLTECFFSLFENKKVQVISIGKDSLIREIYFD